MRIPEYVSRAMQKLSDAGFESYLVGGCVRDFLMNKNPHDYDLTTSALPNQMTDVFSEERIIDTGLKHGTLTLLTESGALEITTYRVDGDYDDNRHPSTVSFTRNINEDLSRRDFTINAMAMSANGDIIDLFGGKEDIEKRVIRCVGAPGRRFGEDGLRIMRAMRFASVLDFSVEAGTADAARRLRGLLDGISAERINSELSKLLCGAGAARIFTDFQDIMQTVLPEVSRDAMAKFAVLLPDLPNVLTVRLAMLFSLCPDARDRAQHALTRLKFSNAAARQVLSCVSFLSNPPDAQRVSVARAASDMDYDLLYASLDAMDAAARKNAVLYTQSEVSALRDIAADLQSSQTPLAVSELCISGEDIISAGAKRGPEIGRILNNLLQSVINNETVNTRENLISSARKMIQSRKR